MSDFLNRQRRRAANNRKNGDIRPVPSTAVFITVSDDGVVLRDSWEETDQTGYWRA